MLRSAPRLETAQFKTAMKKLKRPSRLPSNNRNSLRKRKARSNSRQPLLKLSPRKRKKLKLLRKKSQPNQPSQRNIRQKQTLFVVLRFLVRLSSLLKSLRSLKTMTRTKKVEIREVKDQESVFNRPKLKELTKVLMITAEAETKTEAEDLLLRKSLLIRKFRSKLRRHLLA